MQNRSGRKSQGSSLDSRPGLTQVGNILRQFGVAGFLGVGPQNEATNEVSIEGLKTLPQFFALSLRYFLRDANMVVLRQKNQQATCNADLPSQPRAFGAHRILEHLHHQRLPFEKLSFDGLSRRQNRSSGQRTGHRRSCVVFCMAAVDSRNQIGHVQEGRTIKPDVDECRLHARQHAHHFAEINVADQATLQRAFYLQFLHGTMFHHSHARFLR